MALNWTIFLFMALAILLLTMIFLFVRLNNRNNQFYNTIHSDLMNLVPLKIDLENEMINFFSRLEVLNNRKRVSIFVFKSMINRKARVELEILFQNLLVNKVPFTPVNYLIYFQLHNKIIIYDLTLDYYDQENKILYGQMQSNTRYNRFVITERIDVNPAQLTVPKADFIATILSFFKGVKNNKETNIYEYMLLIKIKNYSNLESILTINNIQSMELLLTYCAKNLLGATNTLICKYYDGEFLVYTRHKKINLTYFQKRLNSYVKNNLVEKSSYLQIQTQILAVSSLIKGKGSNVSTLYNKIIDVNLLDSNYDIDLREIRLKPAEHNEKVNNHYELIHSQEIKKLLEITIAPVYKTDNAKEPDCYYARLGLIDNDYYGNYVNLIRNIQDAGLWWKVYEPMFLQVLHDFAQLKTKKSLIVPFLLMELENKTVLTQIINIIKKRQNLFKDDASLIFDFQDNSISRINNWVKYENIISTLREHNVKIAFSHELRNINNYKLISHYKPDFVILTANLLQNVSFRFKRYIKLIICLNYLNILGVKKIIALGVDSVPEIIMLKSLNIKYLSGSIFESENVDRIIDSLNYPNYWSWKKSQNKKGNS